MGSTIWKALINKLTQNLELGGGFFVILFFVRKKSAIVEVMSVVVTVMTSSKVSKHDVYQQSKLQFSNCLVCKWLSQIRLPEIPGIVLMV